MHAIEPCALMYSLFLVMVRSLFAMVSWHRRTNRSALKSCWSPKDSNQCHDTSVLNSGWGCLKTSYNSVNGEAPSFAWEWCTLYQCCVADVTVPLHRASRWHLHRLAKASSGPCLLTILSVARGNPYQSSQPLSPMPHWSLFQPWTLTHPLLSSPPSPLHNHPSTPCSSLFTFLHPSPLCQHHPSCSHHLPSCCFRCVGVCGGRRRGCCERTSSQLSFFTCSLSLSFFSSLSSSHLCSLYLCVCVFFFFHLHWLLSVIWI